MVALTIRKTSHGARLLLVENTLVSKYDFSWDNSRHLGNVFGDLFFQYVYSVDGDDTHHMIFISVIGIAKTVTGKQSGHLPLSALVVAEITFVSIMPPITVLRDA